LAVDTGKIMSCQIITRNLGSGNVNMLQMQNSQFGRKVNLPVGWNTIRLGFLWQFNTTTTLTGTPVFIAGFGSGITNLIGDASPTNFIGIMLTYDQFLASWNGANALSWYDGSIPCTNVAGVATVDWTQKFNSGVNQGVLYPNTGFSFTPVYIDITKGSPNYSINASLNTSSSATPCTEPVFYSNMQVASPAPNSNTYSGAKTMPFDESNGNLDSIQMYWDRTTGYPEFAVIAVAVIA